MTLLRDQIGVALAASLQRDPRGVVLGEDAADGGVYGWTAALLEDEALRARVVATPLLPSTMLAYAAGLARGGVHPVVLLPTLQHLRDGWAGLADALAGDGGSLPLVVIAPVGPGGLPLHGHADADPALESALTELDPLRVVVAGSRSQAPGLVRAATEFWTGEHPTLVLIPRRFLLETVSEPASELTRPFAQPQVVRDGAEATVFAWGEAIELCLQALEQSGVDATIVDIERLHPLPEDELVDIAARTGKIVIVHAGTRPHAVADHLAAVLADRAVLSLDAPITHVRAARQAGELPSMQAIADAVRKVAYF